MMKTLESNCKELLLACILPILLSCSQQDRDRQIKADITIKAKEDLNFADVHFTVREEIVTLWGNCPTVDSRAKLQEKLSTIHVIKKIDDQVVVSPVSIGSSFTKKLKVDSILASYPQVSAEVSDYAVNLMGNLQQEELKKLLQSFDELKAGEVNIDKLQLIKN